MVTLAGFSEGWGASASIAKKTHAQRYGVDLSLARVHSGTHRLLQLAGAIDEIGEHCIYHTVRKAVDAATSAMAADSNTSETS